MITIIIQNQKNVWASSVAIVSKFYSFSNVGYSVVVAVVVVVVDVGNHPKMWILNVFLDSFGCFYKSLQLLRPSFSLKMSKTKIFFLFSSPYSSRCLLVNKQTKKNDDDVETKIKLYGFFATTTTTKNNNNNNRQTTTTKQNKLVSFFFLFIYLEFFLE